METRFISLRDSLRRTEAREDPNGAQKICGYASVFYRADDPGTEYELGRFGNYRVVERIMPSAFDRAIREDDVRALFNHDPSNILGRLQAGTLRLSVDSIGLRYEIDPPDTQMARDLMESLKRGDVSGSSFSFDYLKKDIIMQQDGEKETDIVEVRDVKLYDVGPVSFAAYSSASSYVRSTDSESLRGELEALRGERLRNPAGKRARARLLDLE